MKPVVDRLRQTYGSRIDFVVYDDVNADQQVSEFATGKGVEYVPTMALVDASGKEVRRWVGGVSEAELNSAFEEAAR